MIILPDSIQTGRLDLYKDFIDSPSLKKRNQIFEILKTKAISQLTEMNELNEARINEIINPPDDDNHIGQLNIVTLQIIVFFMQFVPPRIPDRTSVYKHHVKMVEFSSRSLNYSYNEMRDLVLSDKNNLKYLYKPIEDTVFIIVDQIYLHMNDVVDSMMDKIFLVGLSFTEIMTDDNNESPLGVCLHDINKGVNYLESVEDKHEKLKLFYNFFKTNLNKEELYKCNIMFYLLINECYVRFFIENGNVPTKENVIPYITSQYDKLTSIHDLGGLTPEYIRELLYNTDEEKQIKYDEIQLFMDESIDIYLKILTEWNNSESSTLSLPKETGDKADSLTNVYLNPNKDSIFQVSIHSEDQFKTYTSTRSCTGFDCFIQCLFVLGLRDITESRQDMIRIQSATVGTSWCEACNYFQQIFGIEKNGIIHIWSSIEFIDGDSERGWVEKAINYKMKKIDNGNATILTLRIRLNNDTTFGHYVVAYKIKEEIFYFDPQQDVSRKNPNKNPNDLFEHMKIFNFGFFKLNVKVSTRMPLLTNTSFITFYGGKTRRGKRGKTRGKIRGKRGKTYKKLNRLRKN